ncbi:uncharacterized protein BO72DRAFT_188717 [Aspergillus fijiensis CBS 313.89]|uniref:Uncharacterized protein n=1 Tax=Aspergillus fijiensis CBS 313.89 TaxID=1448319 RepID=A0A8G1RP31_9EURO|nr:uncharacterized protein BO72DRAFT_188717 [Aspergillus fijiensis CBS 313.89]RAK74951.1 hypothetical protein BO72DRAFT_188717 [Aspergillus fijiensis CBS 313.89]
MLHSLQLFKATSTRLCMPIDAEGSRKTNSIGVCLFAGLFAIFIRRLQRPAFSPSQRVTVLLQLTYIQAIKGVRSLCFLKPCRTANRGQFYAPWLTQLHSIVHQSSPGQREAFTTVGVQRGPLLGRIPSAQWRCQVG